MPNPLQFKIELVTEKGDHGENAVRLRNATHHVIEQFNVVANQIENALRSHNQQLIDENNRMRAELAAMQASVKAATERSSAVDADLEAKLAALPATMDAAADRALDAAIMARRAKLRR